MMRKFIPLAILVGLVAAPRASEDDLLIEVSPTAIFQTQSVSNPGMGGTVGFTKGINDRNDLGGFVHFDDIKFDDAGQWVQYYTVGMQSWYTTLYGDFRPQLGGRIGFTYVDGTAIGSGYRSFDLHLSVQARVVAEFSTNVRGFLGGSVGGDLGEHGRGVGGIELGLQFLL